MCILDASAEQAEDVVKSSVESENPVVISKPTFWPSIDGMKCTPIPLLDSSLCVALTPTRSCVTLTTTVSQQAMAEQEEV